MFKPEVVIIGGLGEGFIDPGYHLIFIYLE